MISRFLWATFLFCLYAHPSHAVVALTCPGGQSTYPSTSTAEIWCPPRITITGTTHTNTTVTLNGTSTHAEGTIYVVARIEACSETNQNWRNIADRVGEAHANAVVSASTWSVTITGLAAETEYCIPATQTADGKPSPVQYATVQTDASGGGGGGSGEEITGGDDYFAGVGGSNAASGLTHANRWADWPASDTTLGSGGDIWLYTGSVWTIKDYRATRAGSSGNYSEIGCYYMDGSTPRRCVKGTHTRPEIRGGLTQSCIDAGTCLYNATGIAADGLVNEYDTHFFVEHTADYHRVENIVMKWFRGPGPTWQGSWPTAGSLTYQVVKGVDVIETGQGPMLFENGVRYVNVDDAYVEGFAICELQRLKISSANTAYCNYAGWPGGIAFTRNQQAQSIVQNTTVFNGLAEAVNCSQSTSGVIFRNIRAGNVHSRVWGTDGASDCILENSIIKGNIGQTLGYYGTHTDDWTTGTIMGHEDFMLPNGYQPQGGIVRNNVFIGNGAAFICYLESSSQGNTYRRRCGIDFLGNTVVGMLDNDVYDELNTPLASAPWNARFVFKNNVFWSEALTTSSTCVIYNQAVTHQFEENHWYQNPSDADCDGSGDTYGDPDIGTDTYSTLTTGYGGESFPTFAQFDPQVSSPVKGTGVAMTADLIDDSAGGPYGWAIDQITDIVSGTITKANWKKALYYDATNAVRAGTPSKGAVE